MKNMIENIVKDQLDIDKLKDKLTSVLVKQGRGTYQAFEECSVIQNEICGAITAYLHSWLLDEFSSGSLKKKILEEYNTQLIVELSRKGFHSIV